MPLEINRDYGCKVSQIRRMKDGQEKGILDMKGVLTCEAPNGELYKFEASHLKLEGDDNLVALEPDNVILRGSSI